MYRRTLINSKDFTKRIKQNNQSTNLFLFHLLERHGIGTACVGFANIIIENVLQTPCKRLGDQLRGLEYRGVWTLTGNTLNSCKNAILIIVQHCVRNSTKTLYKVRWKYSVSIVWLPPHCRDQSSRSTGCVDAPIAAHSPVPVVSQRPLASPVDKSMGCGWVKFNEHIWSQVEGKGEKCQ